MKVLGSAAVEAMLSMERCIAVVDEAMRAVSRGEVVYPQRTVMPLAGGNAMGLMPGAMPGQGCFGLKAIALFPGNSARGLPSHAGAVLFFDVATGTPRALIEADSLTAIRTAAATAVATRALARPGGRVLALLGAGHQAVWHARALRQVMPFSRLQLWSRNSATMAHFRAAVGDLPGVEIVAMDSARQAVQGADVVCTLTGAREPILEGAWLVPGQHVNLVGASVAAAREADVEVVRRARYIVDARASAEVQAGEWRAALAAGAVTQDHLQGEIGEVLLGRVPGRTDDTQITVYKSLGHAAQDLAAAAALLQRVQGHPDYPDVPW